MFSQLVIFINIFSLLFQTYCVVNGILIESNLLGIFLILLFNESIRKIITNIYIVISELAIINIQWIFWIGLIYVFLNITYL